MKRLMSLARVTAFALWLTGCAALRPALPDTTAASFRTSVETQSGTKTFTLDHVKATFGTLFVDTRSKSAQKDSQQWFNAETTSVGGFAAVLGQIASKTGLLNTGLGLTMGSLALKGLYDPGKTEETHLAAEEMFVCMQRELGPVNEELRVKALRSKNGNAQANTVVDDVIARIDEAIFSYRKAVLTQTTTAPSKDDFSRFAREYAAKENEAGKQALAASTEKRNILVTRDAIALAHAQALRAAEAISASDAKITATATANELQRSRLSELDGKVADAEADAAGAKFISLSTNLEACAKQFRK